jgi:hypothetical protein
VAAAPGLPTTSVRCRPRTAVCGTKLVRCAAGIATAHTCWLIVPRAHLTDVHSCAVSGAHIVLRVRPPLAQRAHGRRVTSAAVTTRSVTAPGQVTVDVLRAPAPGMVLHLVRVRTAGTGTVLYTTRCVVAPRVVLTRDVDVAGAVVCTSHRQFRRRRSPSLLGRHLR